jgi:hypothetical protein
MAWVSDSLAGTGPWLTFIHCYCFHLRITHCFLFNLKTWEIFTFWHEYMTTTKNMLEWVSIEHSTRTWIDLCVYIIVYAYLIVYATLYMYAVCTMWHLHFASWAHWGQTHLPVLPHKSVMVSNHSPLLTSGDHPASLRSTTRSHLFQRRIIQSHPHVDAPEVACTGHRYRLARA